MKKLILFALVILLLVPFSVFAGGRADNDGRPRVGILLPPVPNDFHAAVRDNVLAATAQHPDINWTIRWATSAADQVPAAQFMMDEMFDLMIIMPSDGALMTPVAEAIYNAGTPTVIVNRPLNPGARFTALVTGDNFRGGQNAARVLGERLGGTGNLAVLRFGVGNPIDTERLGGFMDVFPREFPNINIVGQAEGGVNRTGGLTAMETLLIAHPQIDALFSLDDEAALGAITAIRAAGRTDIRYITGFGGAREAYDLLAANDPQFIASMSFNPSMIVDGVEMAVRILRGGTFPRETLLTSHVVDSNNVHLFMHLAY
jgi:ribose transport system substrate-binding protein